MQARRPNVDNVQCGRSKTDVSSKIRAQVWRKAQSISVKLQRIWMSQHEESPYVCLSLHDSCAINKPRDGAKILPQPATHHKHLVLPFRHHSSKTPVIISTLWRLKIYVCVCDQSANKIVCYSTHYISTEVLTVQWQLLRKTITWRGLQR